MSEKDNGGPAYPCQYQGDTRSDAFGMTLRDYFAAKAMQAFVANACWSDKGFSGEAEGAYRVADAMLAERAK